MSILVIAEHDHNSIKPATLHTVAAAVAFKEDIHVLIMGYQCQGAVEAAQHIQGVAKVLVCDALQYQHQLAEECAAVVVHLGKTYSAILAPATTTGKNMLPRAAAMLDVQPLSDVIAIVSPQEFQRPIYAGNVIATETCLEPIKIMTIRTTAFDKVNAQGNSAPVENMAPLNPVGLSEFVGESLANLERPELTAAKVVVSGGRGLQNGDNFKLVYALADKLGAAVGASRAAVDAGFVPNDLQVGQTGKVVAPELYIAVGISGAIQHLAGMKDSKVIVAINKDPDAPIFQVADYGLVGDLFQVLPELTQKL